MLPALSSSLTQLSWTFGSAIPSMSIVITVPAARIDLVISALAVSGGVDGRMKDGCRVEDIGIAGQGEVVGDVERGRDRVVRRVRSERGVAGAHARAWRRVALIGKIAEQGVVAAAAVDRVVAALAGQHVGRTIAGQPVIDPDPARFSMETYVSPPDLPPVRLSLTPLAASA